MWYAIYNMLLIAASPVIFVLLLAKKRCRPELRQRFGFPPRRLSGARQTAPLIWVHAVSLGEVVAAVPLIRALHTREPDYRIVVTTVTETGREAVEQRLAGIAEHRYAPLDFPWVVSRVLDRFDPSLFVFVETELWPNLLRALAKRKVPVVLVNGRLSSRSFRRYQWIRPFMRQVLEYGTAYLMQSDRDAERIRALGAPESRVRRTGNIKFDQWTEQAGHEPASPAAKILAEHEELLVAGSTHPGEEEALLACYKTLHEEFPRLVLLMAPRHIDRAAQVEATAAAMGFEVIRRSRLDDRASPWQDNRKPRVVILDTRGELAAIYRHAALAFVGGTLVPVGGHNLLEPAAWGKPVLFGPHTDHCFEVAELLERAQGGRRVPDGRSLAEEMARLLRDRSALQRMGAAARQALLSNRGALERSVEAVVQVLHASNPKTERASGARPLLRTEELRP